MRVIEWLRRRFDSLRQRMVALFVLILLLPAILGATLAIHGFRQQSEQARLQAGRYASLAAAFEQQRLIGVRQTLQSLVVLLADLPAGQCSTRLVAAVSPYPELAEVLVVEARGGGGFATRPPPPRGRGCARPRVPTKTAPPGLLLHRGLRGPPPPVLRPHPASRG